MVKPAMSRLLRRLATALGFGALLLLGIALAWTLTRIAAFSNPAQEAALTTEARSAHYRETATALNVDVGAGLRHYDQTVLLQQRQPTDATSTATQEPPPTDAPPSSATPEAISLPKLLLPQAANAGKRMAGTRVPPQAPPLRREHSLVNIALLGSDDELTDDSFIRTDTMIVVSLNLDTGTIAMLSLPRDLFVYLPHGNMGRLNTAFGIGAMNGWDPGGGFGLLRQTLFYNFGLNVHYYARVNFSSFESIIDRLGGVDIAVDCAYKDYYPVNRGEGEPLEYRWRELPVGYYRFDGFDALWYARTRRYTDDFDRGRRHQQLLRAIWRQVRAQGLIATVPQLWRELIDLVDTDIPFDLALRLLPHLIDLELSEIENFTLLKIVHTTRWKTPDGAEVLLPNEEAVARLMQDFYTPPSPYQTALRGPSIGVYNGSGQENWDIVASERLRWSGYNAVALGASVDAGEYPSNVLRDYVGSEKGSPVPGLLEALNMTEDQVERAPAAKRDYDYAVVIGRDYESCTFGVLPINR